MGKQKRKPRKDKGYSRITLSDGTKVLFGDGGYGDCKDGTCGSCGCMRCSRERKQSGQAS